MGIEWTDRGGYGTWYGKAEGVWVQLHVKGFDGWRIVMWGPKVPEDRQYPEEMHRTADDAKDAAEQLVAELS